ncbi:hypothetical protein ACLK1S_19125 [Escherichia coli]
MELFRPLRATGTEAGYDGVEVMGSEGYLIKPISDAAHQSA